MNFGTLAVKYENGDSIQGGVNALKFVTGGVNYTTFHTRTDIVLMVYGNAMERWKYKTLCYIK